jgi:hypothetical protein
LLGRAEENINSTPVLQPARVSSFFEETVGRVDAAVIFFPVFIDVSVRVLVPFFPEFLDKSLAFRRREVEKCLPLLGGDDVSHLGEKFFVVRVELSSCRKYGAGQNE